MKRRGARAPKEIPKLRRRVQKLSALLRLALALLRTPGFVSQESAYANAQVDALISSGLLRRMLALTELEFANSMIEEVPRHSTRPQRSRLQIQDDQSSSA
jgi:hypothetical protein